MAKEYKFSSSSAIRDFDFERSRESRKSRNAARLLVATFGYSSRVSTTSTSSRIPVLSSSELKEKQRRCVRTERNGVGCMDCTGQ